MAEPIRGLGPIAARLPESLLLVSGDGHVIDANAAAASHFGKTVESMRDLKISSLLDDSDGEVRRYLSACATSGSPLMGRIKPVFDNTQDSDNFRCTGFAVEPARPGQPARILMRLIPAQDATRQFRLLTERIDSLGREVERRIRAEQVLDSQRDVLEMIAEDKSLPHVLEALTGFIDRRSTAGCKSSILLLDTENSTLHHGAAPALPDFYCKAIDGLKIGPEVGSCGTAAFLNRFVAVSDIETDPLWAPFVELALSAGLRSCYSTPIVDGEKNVLGTFALYYDTARELDAGDRDLVEFLARSAALAIERGNAAAEISDLLERERSARQDAEEANRSKDEFLAMVSHELRNPLNAILGWARVLTMDASNPDSLANGLDAIERNASLQSRLINEILDYSRIKAGKLSMEPEQSDIGELLRSAIESSAPNAAACKINLRFDNQLDNPIVMSLDPNRIQQVINNIVGNALKFTPEGGDVIVRLTASKNHVQIDITDTGCGIAPEFLPHIFERFRQQDGSQQREHEGLGLGLAIVREVIELHKGEVSAHSDGAGSGCRFTVRLPRKWPQARVTAPTVSETPQLTGARILAVDDAADTRALLKTVFSTIGATVDVAANGREALDLLQRNQFDMLLCDIGMPGMDGHEVIRRQRGREAASGACRLPAIALTAYARSRDRKQAIEAGFDSHMAKPIDPAMLTRVVAEAIAGKTPKQD